MSVTFRFSWVIGSRHDIHDLSKARSLSYVATQSIGQQPRSYKQLLSGSAAQDIPASFWDVWRLIRAGQQINWDDIAQPDHGLYLVQRIGHWSTTKTQHNPLAVFPEGVWKEE